MAKKSPYPKTLYVKFEDPEDDGGYFNAHRTSGEIAEVGETIEVGIYELVRLAKVTANPELA